MNTQTAITLHFITATIVEQDEFTTRCVPFRGIAFRDPVFGHWCALRSGCAIAYCLGDELIIRQQRAVRSTWQPGLSARLPLRVRNALQPA